jgi:hypothetical protein
METPIIHSDFVFQFAAHTHSKHTHFTSPNSACLHVPQATTEITTPPVELEYVKINVPVDISLILQPIFALLVAHSGISVLMSWQQAGPASKFAPAVTTQ